MPVKYSDEPREDILQALPADGRVIGSIGCSTGATEGAIVALGRQVHGVDISAEAISIAQTRLTSARVIAPDNFEPFAPDSLDGLILADVIEHIPAAWNALNAFSRAVKVGGWILISLPNMLYIEAVSEYLFKRDWPETQVGIFDETHLQFMTARRLERWCGMAGLRIEAWHDKYNYAYIRWHPRLDRWTGRIFHDFFTYQLMATCRRLPAAPAEFARKAAISTKTRWKTHF